MRATATSSLVSGPEIPCVHLVRCSCISELSGSKLPLREAAREPDFDCLGEFPEPPPAASFSVSTPKEDERTLSVLCRFRFAGSLEGFTLSRKLWPPLREKRYWDNCMEGACKNFPA